MRKLNKKQKIIILVALVTVAVIIALIVGANVIKTNIINSNYNSANNNSSSSNLLPEYIKEGITLGGVTGTLIDLDTSDATATEWDITYGETAYVDGEKITGLFVPKDSLEIGDYVEYTPDTADSYFLSSTYSGYETNQTITQEEFKWRILKINEDGTIILISSTATVQVIGFSGALGYNNGVYLLNDISEKLYSNSNLGVTARSLSIEDIEEEMTDEGVEYAHNFEQYDVEWGGKVTYTNHKNYPIIYALENGSGINTTDVKKDGINKNDAYYNSPTTETYLQASTSLTITKTFYSKKIASNYYKDAKFYSLINIGDIFYWLASRIVDASYNNAAWGLACVYGDEIGGRTLFDSISGESPIDNRTLRPIVTLNGNITLYGGDGTEEHPYQLKK